MEFDMLSFTGSILGLFFFIYFSARIFGGRSKLSGKVAPEAAGGWPLIGHLHLLGGPKLPPVLFGEMADKYGPIFTIRMGVHRSLVISNWETVKECFTTHDMVFSNRPKVRALDLMAYNYAMFSFAPYGSYWREIRKIVTLEVLSNHRLAMLNHVRESEMTQAIKDTYQACINSVSDKKVAAVEMKKWFGDITIKVMCRLIAGRQFTEEEGEKCRKSLRGFFQIVGVFTVGDAVPFLRWLDLGGYEKIMKSTAEELDSLFQGWLDEHKRKQRNNSDQIGFMSTMVSILDGFNLEGLNFDADTITKSTCQTLALGATDTITVTIIWALALLLNNRHTLKKAQDEIDFHVGRARKISEADTKNLSYIQAIVKETLRLYPATQLSPPREAREDCVISGYHVPAGTRLFVNLWKLHRDPRIWNEPDTFMPERFLTTHKDIDMRGQNFEFIPFGSGRRACLGISFALQSLHFTLASLLHTFDVATPSNEAVDMTESFGFTSIKTTPFEVVLTPRLSAELYE